MGETHMEDSASVPGNLISQETKSSTSKYWNTTSELSRSFKQTEDRAFNTMEVGYSYIHMA